MYAVTDVYGIFSQMTTVVSDNTFVAVINYYNRSKIAHICYRNAKQTAKRSFPVTTEGHKESTEGLHYYRGGSQVRP